MDRFEVKNLISNPHRQSYLHSSMDRFEGFKIIVHKNEKEIYIPVWIDLKPQSVREKYNAIEDLHSSMDRFEGVKLYRSNTKTNTFTFQYG